MAANTADLSGGPVLLSFSLATGSFALSTTFVRFCVRAGMQSGFWADDYASAAATVVALVGIIFGIFESTASDPARALEFDVLGQPWYLMSVTLSKTSILLFFMSSLGRGRQWTILLGALIIIMAAVNLAFWLTVHLQCRPLEKLWKPSVEGECWDPSVQLSFGYFQGAFSVFSWLFLALFSTLIVRNRTRHGEKSWPFYITTVLSFAAGIFSIVRTAQSSQTSGSSVYTIHYFYMSLMANLEQNLGLMAANVLVLGPLFSSATRSSSRRSNRSRNRSRKTPRDPYASSSSAGSSRSRKQAAARAKTPSRAGSTQSITRASSRASSTREGARELALEEEDIASSRRGVSGGSELITQGGSDHYHRQNYNHGTRYEEDDDGADTGEYDLGEPRHRRKDGDHEHSSGVGHGGDGNESDSDSHTSDSDMSDDEDGDVNAGDIDLEAWPRGIIKTVSVEVVEEINPDYVPPAQHASGNNNNNNKTASIIATGLGAGAGAGAGRTGRSSVLIGPSSSGLVSQRVAGGGGGGGGRTGRTSAAAAAAAAEQDWEAMLRLGPTR